MAYLYIFRQIHSMFLYSACTAIMHRNAAVISVTCILLCLTFNYTFPLHRDSSKWNVDLYGNLSRICDKTEHHEKIVERTKKMASNLESALKRIKGSTQDFSKNIQARFNTVKNAFTEEDLRQYEQLVIMKKNPYLDLKEIELKFSPTDKNVRQSIKFDAGPLPQNFVGDPSIWEPMEEGPNVEITNRGLTGFAIPAKIIKPASIKENKLKLLNSNIKTSENIASQNEKLGKTTDVLDSLHDDIVNLL